MKLVKKRFDQVELEKKVASDRAPQADSVVVGLLLTRAAAALPHVENTSWRTMLFC